MHTQALKNKRMLEIMLIVVAIGTTALFYTMGEQAAVVLNLFYLPVLLAGYFLGRNSAGILSLLCALAVTVATALSSAHFAAYSTPIMVGLMLTIWAAALGLTAILMGTLCDERAAVVNELHKAYVGVVEVLSKYLQSANPHTKARSIRIAELSQMVAQKMRLSRRQIDDIRVAALLHDLESVEITTQLVTKAVDVLERDTATVQKHTFLGTDLVHSLGSVLEGALPLIVSQNDDLRDCVAMTEDLHGGGLAVGAQIIIAVRRYDALTNSSAGRPATAPDDALRELRVESGAEYEEVLDALAHVIQDAPGAHTLGPAQVEPPARDRASRLVSPRSG